MFLSSFNCQCIGQNLLSSLLQTNSRQTPLQNTTPKLAISVDQQQLVGHKDDGVLNHVERLECRHEKCLELKESRGKSTLVMFSNIFYHSFLQEKGMAVAAKTRPPQHCRRSNWAIPLPEKIYQLHECKPSFIYGRCVGVLMRQNPANFAGNAARENK